jgi:hypothetical protein
MIDFRDTKLVEMSRGSVEAFSAAMLITTGGNGKVFPPDILEKVLVDYVPFQILRKRLRAVYKRDIADIKVMVCCAALCDNPAKLVMWAYQIALIAKELGRNVTFEDLFVHGSFAMGVPSQDSYKKAWESQKQGANNSLDTLEPWPKL